MSDNGVYRIAVRTEDVRVVSRQVKHIIEEIILIRSGVPNSIIKLEVDDIFKRGLVYSVPKSSPPTTRYYPPHRIVSIEVKLQETE